MKKDTFEPKNTFGNALVDLKLKTTSYLNALNDGVSVGVKNTEFIQAYTRLMAREITHQFRDDKSHQVWNEALASFFVPAMQGMSSECTKGMTILNVGIVLNGTNYLLENGVTKRDLKIVLN